MLFHYIEWDIVQQYENYLKTGVQLDIHSFFGCRSCSSKNFFFKNVLHKLFKHIYNDILRMEGILIESNLNWTVIRPTRLINAHTMKYKITINEPIQYPSKISRADLDEYIVNHLTDEKTYKALIGISY